LDPTSPSTPALPADDGTRDRLVGNAVRLFESNGYERTTLDEIAAAASVSNEVALSHFGRKEAVLLEVCERLSREFARRADRELPIGYLVERFEAAIRIQLEIATPYRVTLGALAALAYDLRSDAVPTRTTRHRMRGVFVKVVSGALYPPKERKLVAQLLYRDQRSILDVWLKDRSPGLEKTAAQLELWARLLPLQIPVIDDMPPSKRARIESLLTQLYGQRAPRGALSPPLRLPGLSVE
jgi:AcrR family transcriptional regulator